MRGAQLAIQRVKGMRREGRMTRGQVPKYSTASRASSRDTRRVRWSLSPRFSQRQNCGGEEREGEGEGGGGGEERERGRGCGKVSG